MSWLPWSSSTSKASSSGTSISVNCHFCNSSSKLLVVRTDKNDTKGKGKAIDIDHTTTSTGTVRDWWCCYCGCRNQRDQNGSILITDPAQYDPRLNENALLLRGTPERSDTPSKPAIESPFCRTCLSNQALQIHLLASYSSSDPSSESTSTSTSTSQFLKKPRLRNTSRNHSSDPPLIPDIESYKHSLDIRYPLVCSDCLPFVEGLIKERDYKVKSLLLASRLRESRGGVESRKNDLGMEQNESRRRRKRDGSWWGMVVIWRIRGVLWYLTWIGWIGFLGLEVLDYQKTHFDELGKVLFHPAFNASSILWNNWNPTWLKVQKTLRKGARPYIVEGRRGYICVQMIAFFIRLGYSIYQIQNDPSPPPTNHQLYLLIPLSILFILSFFTIKVKPKPILRLHPSKPLSSLLEESQSSSNSQDPLEPIEHLSLSNSPIKLTTSTTLPSFKTHPNTPISSSSRSLSASQHHQPPPRPTEPKFGEPWISQPPNSHAPTFGEEDVEMTPLNQSEHHTSDVGKQGAEGKEVVFGPSKVRWDWYERSSGLDDLFERGMRVDDDDDESGGKDAEGKDKDRSGKEKWWMRLLG